MSVIVNTMIIRNFNTAVFVTLAITKWTQGQDSGAVVSALMKKHASFDGNLPRTSACYISEIDNTSPLQCASQCLTRPDVCHGILFNRDSKACKLIKCNPAFIFTDGQFDTGKWELHWKENGKNYIYIFFHTYHLSICLICQSVTILFFLYISLSLQQSESL